MSEFLDSDPPEDDMEMLAAEYVLGVLSQAQMPHVVALRHGSARFDNAVQQWEQRFLPLAEALAPVAPPPRVWTAISEAVGGVPTRNLLWDNLRFWRGFSLAAGALCAALIAGIFIRTPPVNHPQLAMATATLASKNAGLFVATAQAGPTGAASTLIVSPSQVVIPPGKSAELWLITPGNKPAPLGLLASERPVSVTIPAGQLGANISLAELAVSIEPLGGSPTGQPTGPIISAARFSSF